MGSTARHGFPFPEGSAQPLVHLDIKAAVDAIATKVPLRASGQQVGTTDAGGSFAIVHNLGVIPTHVRLTQVPTGNDLIDGLSKFMQTAQTVTNVQFVVRRADTGAALGTNPYAVNWEAIG
ncbi:MAG TPA: hypothetical protein VNJ54_21210 [Plantibacter sp.]|uniref:hypothetical protein n=1 Tax=Plantibacter sp. TaxID=1871045 RepID=UPI002D100E5A|nr:hypothetical protein [Plantibacter sp.]